MKGVGAGQARAKQPGPRERENGQRPDTGGQAGSHQKMGSDADTMITHPITQSGV